MRHDGSTVGWARAAASASSVLCECWWWQPTLAWPRDHGDHWPVAQAAVCAWKQVARVQRTCVLSPGTLAARRHGTVTQVPAHSYPGHSPSQQIFLSDSAT